MTDFTFAPAAGRYRGEAGRLVTFKAVRDAVDRVTDEASVCLGTLAGQLRTGEVTLEDWQRQSMAIVKNAHIAAGMAAHGGIRHMDQETWGYLGQRIRAEYGYLRDMAAQIANGAQPLNGRLEARARLYGQAARATYESVTGRDQRAIGASLERNILNPGEHCAACKAQSALGWVAVGTLTPIGARTCMANCRCRISYSFKAEAAA
jgi:hypothetical protein